MITLSPAAEARIAEFVSAGRTGQIVLDVNRGRVKGVRLTEYVHVRDDQAASPQSSGCGT